MRFLGKLFLIFLVLIILAPVAVLGYLGFIPGLSSLFGADKPRDLGIKYTEADRTTARAKSQIEYVALPAGTTIPGGWQTSGSREVSAEFTSAEITALMNNRPWKYYPYRNVQVKFNADGSGEISGILIKSRVPQYGASFGAPTEAIEFINRLLPTEPAFYVKGRASLVNNQVALFEPQVFEIGRVPMPLEMILSFAPGLVKPAYALDIGGMTSELSQVQNKRALIIEFINSRLANIPGFYAKSARFAENKLIFEGTLPEKEATVQ